MRSASSFSQIKRETEFLAHDPAKKPRTECCCQPVVFTMTGMVVPSDRLSIRITADCFESSLGLEALALRALFLSVPASRSSPSNWSYFFAWSFQSPLAGHDGICRHDRNPAEAKALAGRGGGNVAWPMFCGSDLSGWRNSAGC